MKKLLTALVLSATLLVGCGESTVLNVNVETEGNPTQPAAFINICDKPIPLSYDPMTRNIYIRNRTVNANGLSCYVYTAYYAPNGLPYRYNPSTNTFEMIENNN